MNPPTQLSAYHGFEVQEAHQNLSTPLDFVIIRKENEISILSTLEILSLFSSSTFQIDSFQGEINSSFSKERLFLLLENFQAGVESPGKIFMERHGKKIIYLSKKNSPFLLEDGCLKLYPSHFAKAKNSYQGAIELLNKKIPTATPWFWAKHINSGIEIYGSRWIPYTKSWTIFLAKDELSFRAKNLEKVSNLLAKLHQNQIYHRDLSHWNLLFDNQRTLWLVDLDELSFPKKISYRRILRNLSQIFCSTLDVCSLTEQKNLWKSYIQKKHLPCSFFVYFLVQWMARRRKKHLLRKYRKKFKKEYTSLL